LTGAHERKPNSVTGGLMMLCIRAWITMIEADSAVAADADAPVAAVGGVSFC